LQVGGRLGDLRLIDARVDLVERLSLAHDRAFGEEAPQDDTGHLRPDLGNLESGDPAG
jgi:hypothetical protein